MGRLDNKVAIVTGAASGIGEAIAREFAKEGAKVIFTDIQADREKELEKELGKNVLFLEHDVSDENQWKKVIKKAEDTFGPINVLVNNAGFSGKTERLEDSTTANYERVISINQDGTYYGMKHVIPPMKRANSGSIINISSVSGLAAPEGLLPYVASKFATRGMTKAAAVELGEYNIRANSIHPDLIETPMVKQFEEESEENAKTMEGLRSQVPMKRGGEPEEVADLAVFLASDKSSYMSGAEFVIDGGKFAHQ